MSSITGNFFFSKRVTLTLLCTGYTPWKRGTLRKSSNIFIVLTCNQSPKLPYTNLNKRKAGKKSFSVSDYSHCSLEQKQYKKNEIHGINHKFRTDSCYRNH